MLNKWVGCLNIKNKAKLYWVCLEVEIEEETEPKTEASTSNLNSMESQCEDVPDFVKPSLRSTQTSFLMIYQLDGFRFVKGMNLRSIWKMTSLQYIGPYTNSVRSNLRRQRHRSSTSSSIYSSNLPTLLMVHPCYLHLKRTEASGFVLITCGKTKRQYKTAILCHYQRRCFIIFGGTKIFNKIDLPSGYW